MRGSSIRLIGLMGLLCLGLFVAARFLNAQEQDEEALSRQDFMRTKLNFTQNIIEGLTTRDFALIISGADEIERITQAENWNANDFEEYPKISEELRSAATHLRKAAEKSNLEAAALRYFELTLKCMDCHQHLRKADF